MGSGDPSLRALANTASVTVLLLGEEGVLSVLAPLFDLRAARAGQANDD